MSLNIRKESEEDYEKNTHRDLYDKHSTLKTRVDFLSGGIAVVVALFLTFGYIIFQQVDKMSDNRVADSKTLTRIETLLEGFIEEIKEQKKLGDDNSLKIHKIELKLSNKKNILKE